MTSGNAIASGLRASRHNKSMVAIFYGCNLLAAAALAAPMHQAIAEHVGTSAAGYGLAQGFSAAWLAL